MAVFVADDNLFARPDTDEPPCTGRPGFLQRGEDGKGYPWGSAPETRAAQKICLSECSNKMIVACAQAALVAGGGIAGGQVARGTVQAGVVCRGDEATAEALRRVVAERGTPNPLADTA